MSTDTFDPACSCRRCGKCDRALGDLTKVRAELAEAKALLHTIWHGTVNAPARQRWLGLIADVNPATCNGNCIHQGTDVVIEDLCCPRHGVDAPAAA